MYKLIITKNDQVVSSTTLIEPPRVEIERLDLPQRVESWVGGIIDFDLTHPPRYKVTVSGVGIGNQT